ncbi:MAG: LptF/LptG family permease, partial [Verrucomicrobiales bacterium]|nr:LptF/LptG family permease [Verrucomicrobiales bacterium]
MFLRIFDRYIGRQISSGTLVGVVILSGVMVLGNVFQKMEQLLGNSQLPLAVVAKFIWLVIPYSLIFTIPWAFLTAILLVFGRMSADNELVSLRMTGSSMPRICLPVFLVSLALSGFCYWANVDLAPSAKNEMKRLFYNVAMEDPSSLFQEGRVLDRVPGYRIYTDKKVDGQMQGLILMELDGTRVLRTIRARIAYL